eukprot:6192686-Pleurochrysis_carterae.AAC.3
MSVAGVQKSTWWRPGDGRCDRRVVGPKGTDSNCCENVQLVLLRAGTIKEPRMQAATAQMIRAYGSSETARAQIRAMGAAKNGRVQAFVLSTLAISDPQPRGAAQLCAGGSLSSHLATKQR